MLDIPLGAKFAPLVDFPDALSVQMIHGIPL